MNKSTLALLIAGSLSSPYEIPVKVKKGNYQLML